jgi:ABC-type multidrug transport system fused ATPase/permease subunit
MTLSLGTLVAFLSYIRMLFQPISDMAARFDIMQSSLTACDRIFKLLDTKEIEEQGNKIIKKMEGNIEFNKVWFSYEDERWVLKDVSFKVNPGEKVAIVGPTGAGKTSLINLLMRFYEPQRGTILVDGIPINEIDIHTLRSKVVLVTQDDFLFSRTVAENIKMGRDGVDDKVVEQVAKFTNAHNFVKKFPHSYNQELKERGANLSGGEAQLISLTRAMVCDSRVVILDEATREVDPDTEALLRDAIYKLLQNRTAIVIAHRLSTIKNVDRIIVLHKGKIIEEGSHEDLMKRNSFYATLY